MSELNEIIDKLLEKELGQVANSQEDSQRVGCEAIADPGADEHHRGWRLHQSVEEA